MKIKNRYCIDCKKFIKIYKLPILQRKWRKIMIKRHNRPVGGK